MGNLVFDIIRIVVFAVFMIASKYIIPLAITWLKSRISENQYQLLIAVINSAVHALEQEFKGQTGQGSTKKEQVTAYVKKYCEKHGIDISDEQISTLIEAAVFGMNQKKE